MTRGELARKASQLLCVYNFSLPMSLFRTIIFRTIIFDARRACSKSVPITVYVQHFLPYVNIPTNHIWKSYLKIIFRQIIFRRDFLCHNRNSFIFELVRETPPEFFSEKLEILQHKFWIPIFFLPPDFICQIHNQIWKKSVKIILGEPHFFIRDCTFI